jgi:hypothetical protein
MVAITGKPTVFSASSGERTPRCRNSRSMMAAAAAIIEKAAAAAAANSQEGDDGFRGILARDTICASASCMSCWTDVCFRRVRND